jgi:hypothetical protein
MKKTKQIMILVAVCAVPLLASTSCGEKSDAALKVMKGKAEDMLVKQAGESEVALALMQKQYADLKERLVRVKTMARSFGRRIDELEASANSLEQSGKADLAEKQRRMAESYSEKRAILQEREVSATEELKNFATLYEETKADLRMLTEEIEMTKAMGGLDTGLGVENPLNTRMDAVKTLTETLRQRLDRAQSLVELGDLEREL